MATTLRTLQTQSLMIQNEQDIVQVRKIAREWANKAQFSLTQQTKLVTAASELARNIFHYAKQGTAEIRLVESGLRRGVQMLFDDQGPGIDDITQAMADGYSTGGSLGMGLGGTQRLVDVFEIQSNLNEGTHVSVIIWK